MLTLSDLRAHTQKETCMRTIHHVLLQIAIVAWCGSVASAINVVSFREGFETPFVGGDYQGAEDTMILFNNGSGQSDQNFGARENFEIGERDSSFPNPFPRRALMRFDVTTLDGRFTSIDRLTLRLFVTNNDAQRPGEVEGAGTLQVFQLADANADWIEGVESNAPPGATADFGMSTWDARVQGAEPWAGSPGAGTPGVDYLTPVLASRGFDEINEATLSGSSFDLELQDTSFFSDWVAGDNAGLFLRVENELNNAISFFSSEAPNPAFRPELIVEFTAIPEPSSLGITLLASCLAVMAGKRRA